MTISPWKVLPSPTVLLERWRALSLIEILAIGPTPAGLEIVAYEVASQHVATGQYNDFDPDGAFAWIVHCNGNTVYYGGVKDRFWEFHGTEIERTARKAMKEYLPKTLYTLIPKRPPKSLGWSFAMWADGLQGKWDDLTGLDPDCWKSAQFDNCAIFYAEDHIEAVARDICEQYEIAGKDRIVMQILRSVPLSEELAREIMPTFDRERAVDAAVQRGYPLADDLRKA